MNRVLRDSGWRNILRHVPAGSALYYPCLPEGFDAATVKDFSGNARHGTITGGTWTRLVSGLPGLVLAGSGRIQWTNFLAALGTGNITFLAWMKATSWANTNTLFSSQSADNSAGISFMGAANLGIRVFSTDTTIATSSDNSISTTAYKMYGFVRSGAIGAGTITIYINDAADGMGDANNLSFSTAGQERIGQAGFAVPSRGISATVTVGLLSLSAYSSTQVSDWYRRIKPFIGV